MRVMVIFFLVLWPTGAMAQDISKKMPLIAPGSTVDMQNSDGERFTQRFLGAQPFPWDNKEYYVYETFNGRGDQEPNLKVYTDETGNAFYKMNPYGGVTKYEPHNCARTIGACSYTRFLPDSAGVRFRRDTKVVAGGYEFSVYYIDETGKSELIVSGRAKLDEMGIAKLRSFRSPSEDNFSIRMLRSNYR